MIANLGLSIWLALNVLSIFIISKKNVSFGVLPNLTIATFITIYVIPIFFDRQISNEFLLSVAISNTIFLTIFIYSSFIKNKYFNILRYDGNFRTLSINGASIFVAIIFCIVGNLATYYSLVAAGGLLSVISDFGGRGYLEARVNNESSGALGILAWLSPFSLAFIFAAALLKRKKSYWIWFTFLFITTALGYGLLTVRHNMVATLIMLMLTYLTFKIGRASCRERV